MKIQKSKTLFLLLASSLVLTGCISLLPKPGKPPTIYPLSPIKDFQKYEDQVPFNISIGLPSLPRANSGIEIVAKQRNGTIAYIDGLNLASSAPISIQNIIIGTFDKSMAFRAVVRGLSATRPDFELFIDVAVFEVEMPYKKSNGKAVIELTARLIDGKSRKPLAIKVFKAEQDAQKGDEEEAAIALEIATQNLSKELLDWSINAGRAYY